MRKQRKTVLAAVAGLLIILALPGTAAAAVVSASAGEKSVGWQQEADGWTYYDQNGQRMVNTWVKSEDRRTEYYLDADGIMAVSQMISDEGEISYVDETGARVKNRWVTLPNNGLCQEPVETVSYYFDSNGKALKDMKKKMGGKTYFFDSEGHMRSGWYEDDGESYYLGTEEEGWVHTGWQCLIPADPEESSGLERWYYFRPGSGKACRGKKKVNGSYHYFDEDTAAMQEGWVEWENQYAYYEPVTGKLRSGWIFCEGPGEGEEGWYYLEKDGVPFNCGGKDSGLGDPDSTSTPGRSLDYVDARFHWNTAAKTVHGDTYLFDENGKMMTGMFYMWEVRNSGGKMLGGWEYGRGGGIYCFDEESGKMLRGRQRLTLEGQEYEYHFNNHGKSYTSCIIEGHLYGIDGALVKAEYGDKYRLVDSNDTDDIVEQGDTLRIKESGRSLKDCLLIVDRDGRVKKNGRVTINGYRYTVKDYVVVGSPEELD